MAGPKKKKFKFNMADTCWKILNLFELKSNYKKKFFFKKNKVDMTWV